MDDQPALPILEVSRLLGLPEELIVNILSRINSDDLARCRAVSNAFPDICTKVLTEVRSVNLVCSLDRYPNSGRQRTPFKKIVTDAISSMGNVVSISICVEEGANRKSLDKKLDDLHLTEESFVGPLLQRVRGGLASLSISDYRLHSHGQWSWVLFSISTFCLNLHELVLKNAWLTTEYLTAMPKLTSLTLAFVRLDDEDLDKVNSCCPSLQILNLIWVEGLKNPRIDLLHLRTCQYVGSSFATTPLQVMCAPNLTSIEVRMGPRTTYEFAIRQRKEKSCAPNFEKNTYFRVPIKNHLNPLSRTFMNHPVLVPKKLILVPVPVQGWSNSWAEALEDWAKAQEGRAEAQEVWAMAQEASALGMQKSTGCTQILLKF